MAAINQTFIIIFIKSIFIVDSLVLMCIFSDLSDTSSTLFFPLDRFDMDTIVDHHAVIGEMLFSSFPPCN